ncbi:MAG: hypothetical protein A2287_01590 [Candidatus Melainabacteria bacterium RIFOXYA12_FULL_32_12]|nr:MAG: hypothetical protein A2255_06390 [Candidatus Melainabacteria bacterium RIFOXYA2_FULL_32_9]OGI24674.1 MAG: hypothetical protein A2287_01590 [Candidatus Melainabacteria bacterium RIFOXYA12_FULL_32_12]
MLLIIRKDIFISFLTLTFLPLAIMAWLSIAIFDKIEENNANNLGADLNAIKLIYNNSIQELESYVVQKSYEISASNTHIINNKKDNADILFVINSDEINNFKNLKPILYEALKKTTSSTEIIPENIIKKYYQKDINSLTINSDTKEKGILAGLAHISACNIKTTNKLLIGIKFIKSNSKLHKEFSDLINGNLLLIEKDYVIAEISKDNIFKQSSKTSLNTSTYKKSNLESLTKTLYTLKKSYIYTIEPIYNYNNAPIGAIFLLKSPNELNKLKKQNTILIVLTILIVGMIISIAAHLTSQRLMNSLEQIAGVAMAVKQGDLSKRVQIKATGKTAQLGLNINKMIESLQDRESRIKKYQREIHEQKEYLEALFNSLADGIITISKDCKITKVNPAINIWSGREEEEIAGKYLAEFLQCKCNIDCLRNKEDIPENCPLISHNERLAPTEAQILNKNTKAEKLLSLNFSQISGVAGEPTYVIVLRDITELKEMDKMREDFTATLTHDLRVPILAEANTLKFFLKGMFGPYTDKQKEAMENMLESNNGLLSLVNSLLDTYKHESGQGELIKEITNIRKLAQDCVAELTPIAKKHNQSLTNFISKETPAARIDKKEIKRVINNLISNAITYTPKGGVIAIDAEEKNNEIIVKVTDTGKGIPESEYEIIFDRFFSKAKKFRKIGTGLGLYLSKRIIEKHNGKIWVESQLGKGSTFYFSLPLDS